MRCTIVEHVNSKRCDRSSPKQHARWNVSSSCELFCVCFRSRLCTAINLRSPTSASLLPALTLCGSQFITSGGNLTHSPFLRRFAAPRLFRIMLCCVCVLAARARGPWAAGGEGRTFSFCLSICHKIKDKEMREMILSFSVNSVSYVFRCACSVGMKIICSGESGNCWNFRRRELPTVVARDNHKALSLAQAKVDRDR